ncbi:MAG: tetratricopeptide repeat protein [Dissulfurimicrobium sp.]|uniref:tetratricopeptide repeat protein n=1 Tax=Dissulfurimicrobium TaxID=1769732 RepID=UPI003C774639
MDAVTYPDAKVSGFLMENMIPLRILFDTVPLSMDFNIKWTPTLITLDAAGKEHHRIVGFVGPDEFIPSMLLGIGKTYLETDRFDKAIASFEKVITEHPNSPSVSEAVYMAGVARFKGTHNPRPLKEAYEMLNVRFPGSEWTKRAYPYRLL